MGLRDVKISVGTIITGASFAMFGGYALSLWNMMKKVQIAPSLRIHSVNFEGMTLVLSVRIINPTNGTVRIKHPYIALYGSPEARANRVPIGNSAVSDQTHTIAPNAETNLPDFQLYIPMGDLLRIVADFARDGKLELVANAQTRVLGQYLLSKGLDKDISLKLDWADLKRQLGAHRVATELVEMSPVHLN